MKQKQKLKQEEGYCEYCRSEHEAEELVPVVAGEIIGKFNQPEKHYRVSGFEEWPEIDYYCPHRFSSQFDVEPKSAVRKKLERVTFWLSWKSSVAFALGVIITALLFLLMTP